MNEQEKQEYLEKYHHDKDKGVPFFPDIIFKDAVITLLIFLILVALAYFLGAPLEARADPADTNYTPRPEWYFLFLFQLLKYFPGNLEVIGVVVLPTLVVLVLFALPFLDRSRNRHFSKRPLIIGGTILIMAGGIILTILSVIEAPPPAQASTGDETAALYTQNCAACHGPSIQVPEGVNLHEVIARGSHEGMPAWSADLSSDQIDALAGFILSPGGSELFTQNCAACHEAAELVSSNPIELKNALQEGAQYPAHADIEIPDWNETLTTEEQTRLLNFLVAPDGQRLYAVNCSTCHGRSVAFAGSEEELRSLISQGGAHLEMPSWQEKLSGENLDLLAAYVVDPAGTPEAVSLFQANCATCHGERIPTAADVAQAREAIATGGAHETMPIWGQVLTSEQMEALVSYTLAAASGSTTEAGQSFYNQNCSICHGEFGEGGPNPTLPDDIIAPISSAEYLATRDDATLQAIISQGQPNFGMSPFSSSNGGPLSDDEIIAIVAYIRSWEANPPVDVPPEVPVSGSVSLNGEEIFQDLCSQCHGPTGQGGVGGPLSDPSFQDGNTDQDIFDTITQGHETTAMIAWGEVLTPDQITELVSYIRQLRSEEIAPTPAVVSFSNDVMPIMETLCIFCHGTSGGWDATSYDTFMNSGDHAPVVIPGDAENSLLAQKILGTHSEGDIMPPAGMMKEAYIQIILEWIEAGALDN
jgi:mono/diheme cytochrome c family protein